MKTSREVDLHVEHENINSLPAKKKRQTKPKGPEQAPLSLPLPDDVNELISIVDSKIRSIKYNTVSSYRKIHEPCEIIANLEFDQIKDDPYAVKKVLEESDTIKGLNRLMMNRKVIKDYISSCWGSDQDAAIISDAGLRVNMYDRDTGLTYPLTFKRWPSNNCYVFQKDWMESFGEKRNLKKGDTIGLYWDSFESHFCFSVLKKTSSSVNSLQN